MTSTRPYVAAVLALALSGCLFAHNVVRTRHFTLEPQISVTRAERVEKTLGFRPLEVVQTYDRRITFLGPDHALGYREHEAWAEPPRDTVTRAIADALAATGRFSDVGNAADMARPDLMLTGELRKFCENRTRKPWTAEIEVRLELRETRGAAALWADTLHIEIPIQGKTTANALAAAMSKAIGDVAKNVAEAAAKAL